VLLTFDYHRVARKDRDWPRPRLSTSAGSLRLIRRSGPCSRNVFGVGHRTIIAPEARGTASSSAADQARAGLYSAG
jgi:hypothetical protein